MARAVRSVLSSLVCVVLVTATCVACQARPAPPVRPVHVHELRRSPSAVPEHTLFHRHLTDSQLDSRLDAQVDAQVDWQIGPRQGAGIEGYTSSVDIRPGDPLSLFVSTAARRYRVLAFRMGWYAGRYGQLVWQSAWQPGHRQHPARLIAAATRTYAADWPTSTTVPTRRWPPGDYLLRLDSSTGGMNYVPLTVRAASAAGRVVLISPVTTWQAYNTWGCCDLYTGRDGSFDSRSLAVSFDRPYSAEFGAGQFLRDQLGILALAEQLHLRLDYVTDVDLQRDAGILRGARAVISMDHDEYWSPTMREALARALGAGTNVAFFGANAIYRRIRFAATPTGADRLEINYKLAAQDPVATTHPRQVTADWPSPPAPDPESRLIGPQYACNLGVGHQADGIIATASSWVLARTHAGTGDRLPGLIGPETDAVQPGYPTPRPIQVLLHSPTACPNGGPGYADTTYRTTANGAAVFDAGTTAWGCTLLGACATLTNPTTQRVVRQMTINVLQAFAAGPAGVPHPAHDNLQELHITG